MLFVIFMMFHGNINILISRGTKGSDAKEEEAQVIVKNENGKQTAVVDLPVNQQDIDLHYKEFQKLLAVTVSSQRQFLRMTTNSQEDYFKSFRTNLVLFWIVSNAALIACMTIVINFANKFL